MSKYYGYWVEYSYRGLMPNGKWRYFASEEEYKEAVREFFRED